MRHTSLQEANTESLASGVGMRFRSFERRGNAFSKWFEGSEGFLGLPHALFVAIHVAMRYDTIRYDAIRYDTIRYVTLR